MICVVLSIVVFLGALFVCDLRPGLLILSPNSWLLLPLGRVVWSKMHRPRSGRQNALLAVLMTMMDVGGKWAATWRELAASGVGCAALSHLSLRVLGLPVRPVK